MLVNCLVQHFTSKYFIRIRTEELSSGLLEVFYQVKGVSNAEKSVTVKRSDTLREVVKRIEEHIELSMIDHTKI